MKKLFVLLVVLTACSPTASPDSRRLPTSNANQSIVFKTYTDKQGGFAFEYPAYYDESFSSCALGTEDNRIYFGDNTLTVTQTTRNLPVYVQASHNDPNERVERNDSFVSSHGLEGTLVQSYWQNVHKTTLNAYFQRGNKVYNFGITLSLACTNQDKDIKNPDMFYHAVDTFRFIP